MREFKRIKEIEQVMDGVKELTFNINDVSFLTHELLEIYENQQEII